jgi:pimeloyl-ACP methyl ester carboxylesterase
MSADLPATEVIFLPGFDGVAELRAPFVAALGESHPARAVGYPNRKLESLAGYTRFAAAQVTPQARPVLVAESFSGLVAARWAASDPHVAGVVLCGAFARSPAPLAALGATMPALAQFLVANFMAPVGRASSDPARRQWSDAFGAAMRSLKPEVIAERLAIISAEDVSADLKRITAPIVLVQFDDDLVIGPSARAHLESVCERATVVRFAGPHFAIETRPRESAAAIASAVAPLFGMPARPATTAPRRTGA